MVRLASFLTLGIRIILILGFPCPDVRDEDRDRLRVKLERVILTVLRRHPALHYFQGYHDVRALPRERRVPC